MITSVLSRAAYFFLLPLTHPSGTLEPWSLLAEREAHQAALYCHATVRFLPTLPPGEKSACQSRFNSGAVHGDMPSPPSCYPPQPSPSPPHTSIPPPDWTNCITYPLGDWQLLSPDATGAGEFPVATEAGLRSRSSSVCGCLTGQKAGTADDAPLSGPPSPLRDFLDSFLARTLCSIIVCQ